MLSIRKSADRGYADHGWLKTFHSFSFANYYDPQHMGWGNLRVINEDYIAPGTGFGTHGHRDMEIITYVVQGALAHKDSMGHVESIPAGDVQRMSAGRGVLHSEFNHAPDSTTHLFQIWIEPTERGIEPGYEQKTFSMSEKVGRLHLLASGEATPGAVRMYADARLYNGVFDAGQGCELELAPNRKGYVQVVRGSINVNGTPLTAGDAALLADERLIRLDQAQDAEVLVFDLSA